MAHVQHHPAIIGWQLDNETKHYDNIGRYMQEGLCAACRRNIPTSTS
jgi:beta-galactosidase